MKRLTSIAFAALIAIGVASGAPGHAAPVVLNFSFNNTNYGGGIVTGRILGLEDNGANQAATSVQVLSNTHPDGFGIGEYIGSPSPNAWTLSGGTVTWMNFSSLGNLNIAPAVTTASLSFKPSGRWQLAGLSPDPGNVIASDVGLIFEATVVPLPPAAALLGSGLVALFWTRRRRGAAPA